ncbi:MAG TPA: isoprenyl transferase [bacterium]|nr:isoprenyl transferase [bacterium]HPJ71702.1 isoprenyl transferase [bacterium]HPQ66154.1 isoprenyl transferase [bacterium]
MKTPPPPEPPPPRHIAVIMDGNGRWARRRGLPRLEGHRVGSERVRTITTACSELGVSYLTLYAFSAENWKRPRAEVSGLMRYLRHYLKQELPTMLENDIRFRTIGDVDSLSPAVRRSLEKTSAATADASGLTLVLALNYGGRQEILEAVRRLARSAAEGAVKPEDISLEDVERHLYTAGIPDPDLVIRTSGEMRLSNFLLWQSSYAELVVTPVLWPDFGRRELEDAIREFWTRRRRFGGLDRSGDGKDAQA